MIAKEHKTNIWLINSLWAKNSKEFTLAPLLDTVFRDPSTDSSYKWLFTDKNGLIKKKNANNSTAEQIYEKFLSTANSGDDGQHVANLLTDNESQSLSKQSLQQILKSFGLKDGEALQVSKLPYWESGSKIIVELKLDSGKPLFRVWKQYCVDNREIKVALAAHAQIDCLKKLSQDIVYAVETNTKSRISSVCLVFIQESDRKLSLLGSKDCVVFSNFGTAERRTSMNASYKTANKSRTCVFPRSSSLKKGAKASLTLKPHKICAGDFCQFTVQQQSEELKRLSGSEIQLIFTEKTPEIFDPFEKPSDFKLSSNFNDFPFKYILLGKYIEKFVAKPMTGETYRIPVNEIEKCPSPSRLPSKSRLTHPSKLYDIVKLCERCYEVYNMIRSIRTKRNIPKSIPLENQQNAHTKHKNQTIKTITTYIQEKYEVPQDNSKNFAQKKYDSLYHNFQSEISRSQNLSFSAAARDLLPPRPRQNTESSNWNEYLNSIISKFH